MARLAGLSHLARLPHLAHWAHLAYDELWRAWRAADAPARDGAFFEGGGGGRQGAGAPCGGATAVRSQRRCSGGAPSLLFF